jgi:hypothetical protein
VKVGQLDDPHPVEAIGEPVEGELEWPDHEPPRADVSPEADDDERNRGRSDRDASGAPGTAERESAGGTDQPTDREQRKQQLHVPEWPKNPEAREGRPVARPCEPPHEHRERRGRQHRHRDHGDPAARQDGLKQRSDDQPAADDPEQETYDDPRQVITVGASRPVR